MPAKKSIVSIKKELTKYINTEKDNSLTASDNIISKEYELLDTPPKILNAYLKVLVSILPLTEESCKRKISEFSVRSLTTLGESIRQTIAELEIYKDPENIINENIIPNLQFYNDQVIKNISSNLANFKDSIIDFIDAKSIKQINNLLIEFLTNLGNELSDTYNIMLDKIRSELLNIRGF